MSCLPSTELGHSFQFEDFGITDLDYYLHFTDKSAEAQESIYTLYSTALLDFLHSSQHKWKLFADNLLLMIYVLICLMPILHENVNFESAGLYMSSCKTKSGTQCSIMCAKYMNE